LPNAAIGTVTLASFGQSLAGTGNALQFALNNPGFGGSTADTKFSTTLYNLPQDTYTLTFNSNAMKVDDVSIAVTAVPEPETYALMLAGLGIVGFVARRRRPNRD
jgi:hypothetical protein